MRLVFLVSRAHHRAPFMHAPRRLPASPRYEGGRGVGGGDPSVQRTQHSPQQAAVGISRRPLAPRPCIGTHTRGTNLEA